MKSIVFFWALLVGHVPAGVAEPQGSSPVLLASENALQDLPDEASHLVIDVKSDFGESLVKEWARKDSLASVELLDQPFVFVASPHATEASGWQGGIFCEDGSFNDTLGEQLSFCSSSALKEVLDDVLRRYKTHNVYLVLSVSSFRKLSMGTLPRLRESTWRGTTAFVHHHKWPILATTTLAVVGSVWWHHHKSGGAGHAKDDASVNSGSTRLFQNPEERLLDTPGTIPERGRVRQTEHTLPTKPIHLKSSAKLESAHMRGFIQSQWVTPWEGYQPSSNAFTSGGVERPTFFCGENNVTRYKTYIALANDYEANDRDRKYVQSGEQSIAIVLGNIKHAIEQEDHYDSTLLIPLQQLDKAHWILLEVILRRNNTEYDPTTSTAHCYDSKGWGSMSNIQDSSAGKKRVDYVKKVVRDAFDIDTKWKREGTQGLLDDHNCGRHVLIKMGTLLQCKHAPRSIKDINKVLAPAEGES